MGAISVLVPFRGDGFWRDKAWAYCRERWDESGLEVVVGEDPGPAPFNISRAFNDAASRARGDVLFLASADMIPDPGHTTATAARLDDQEWVPAYNRTAVYGLDATEAIYEGADPANQPIQMIYGVCTGILAIRAEAWHEIGGMDERFNGWGYEDNAVRLMLTTLYGPAEPSDASAYCLYHPHADRTQADTNRRLYGQYERAAESRDAILAVRFG